MIELSDFPDDVYVAVKDTFRKKIFDKAAEKCGSRNKLAHSLGVDHSSFSEWYNGFRIKNGRKGERRAPIGAYKKVLEIIDMNFLELTSKIISYGAYHGKQITNPKFPISESMHLGHIIGCLFGDGSGGEVKEQIPSYCNTSKEARFAFIEALRRSFGNVPINHLPKHSVVFFSKAISKILLHYYKISSFKTFESKIPKAFLSKPKEFLIGIIKGFTIDEGSVKSNKIELCSGNQILLNGILNICKALDYHCSEIMRYNFTRGVYYFCVYSDSMRKFYSDINQNLIIPKKDEYLRFNLLRQTHGWNHKKVGETRSIILNKLRTKPMTVRKLEFCTGIGASTIRDFHLKRLKEEKEVTVNKLNTEFVWSIAS